MTANASRKTSTLILTTILHAFTHVYQVALVPLYLTIQADLKLDNVGQATALVTVMMISYFVPSYPMGVLADRVSRKHLLGFGLLINGLGFVSLGHASGYGVTLASVAIAGLGGSFFHPAATTLIARLYPQSPGRALGFIGIGASVGFFAGPIFAGWRATQSGSWRTPVLDLGYAGIGAALLFLLLAEPDAIVPRHEQKRKLPLFSSRPLMIVFIAMAFFFCLRDFAGFGMSSLGSLFLQNGHGFDIKTTGITLSGIYLASAISNPLFGHFSDRARIPWIAVLLIISAALAAVFPHLPKPWLGAGLLAYGFFIMATYPIVEAALMELVPDAVRGRIFGLFITIGGLLGNLSHWLIGRWVEHLGESRNLVGSYYLPYTVMGALILSSLGGLLCLRRLRDQSSSATRTEPETSPASTTA